MADLGNGQYELSYLGRSFMFGRKTPYAVEQLDLPGASTTAGDRPRPRANGIMFGRDYKEGRVLGFQGNILTRRNGTATAQSQALGYLQDFEEAWDAEDIRVEPELVTVLRMARGGRTRRVYGRPRRFDPVTGRTYQGWIPVSCDFQTIDHHYYDDQEQSIQIGMVSPDLGGLVGDRIGPWDSSSQGAGFEYMNVGGTKPAWLTIRINGPVVGSLIDPEIIIPGQWSAKLAGEIRYDEFVVINSTPWGRSIRRSDGANWSGKLTRTSRRPSGMRLAPGPHTVILKGTDPSNTSVATVFWRDTFASH